MADNQKLRLQITIDKKTRRLLDLLKDDNTGLSSSEIIGQGIWLWAEKTSPETLKRMHSENLRRAK